MGNLVKDEFFSPLFNKWFNNFNAAYKLISHDLASTKLFGILTYLAITSSPPGFCIKLAK